MGNLKLIHVSGHAASGVLVPTKGEIEELARGTVSEVLYGQPREDGSVYFLCAIESSSMSGAGVRELGKRAGIVDLVCAVLDVDWSDWRLHSYAAGAWVQTLVYEPRRELRSEAPTAEEIGVSDQDPALVLAWKAWAERRPVPPFDDAGGVAYRAWRKEEPSRGPTEYASDPGMPTGPPGGD